MINSVKMQQMEAFYLRDESDYFAIWKKWVKRLEG